jgi:Pretoxin HINT domain/A nuclease family of the HNH/ENDO VII superfamily with conserved AHH
MSIKPSMEMELELELELDPRLHPVAIDADSSAIVPNQLANASVNLEPMDEEIIERQPTYLRKVSNEELFGIIEPDANAGLDTELAGSSQDAELSGRRSDRAPAGEVQNRRQAAAGVAKSGIAKAMDYLKSLPRELVISLLLLFGCLGLITWNGQRLDELRQELPQATTPVSSVDPRANIDSSVGKPSFSVPRAIFDPLKNPDWQLQTAPIESIKVGMRVPAHNPQLSDAERTADVQVDPKTWREFTLEVEKEDGSGELVVTLLRPASWLVEEQQMTDLRLLAVLKAEQETLAETETSWLEQALDVIDLASALDPLADVQDAALEYGGSIWDATQVVSANPLELFARVSGQEIQGRATEIAAETLADEMAVDAVLGGDGVGSEIFLEMPELGAVGFARVNAIEPCPEVIDGPGRVVTATFRHQSANVLDLAFAPVSGPKSETTTVAFNTSSFSRPSASSFLLGVTSVHPFWSVDRADFVPAGELRPLEQVLGIDGQHFRLTSITPRAGPETVYNFEVALDHVYYVGRDGLLVHNFYLIKDGVKLSGASYQAILKTIRAVPDVLIKTGKRLHGHHIVMKGLFRSWLNGSRQYVKGAQDILARAGIDIHDARNMAHAINAGHSKTYAKAVFERLAKAEARKGDLAVNVSKELFRMQQIIEKGGKFW